MALEFFDTYPTTFKTSRNKSPNRIFAERMVREFSQADTVAAKITGWPDGLNDTPKAAQRRTMLARAAIRSMKLTKEFSAHSRGNETWLLRHPAE